MFGSMAQRKTLLVVDDNEELRGAIAEQLQLSEDFSAIEAATAGDGVRAAIENRPDLILGAALVAAHTLANPEVCAALVAAIATDQTATVQESITIEFFDAQFEEDW